MRIAKRRVVDQRQVPGVVGDQPERQRDERSKEREPGRPLGEPRRDREQEQHRSPLREHDVLQQVRPEERVIRKRLELGEECGEDECHAERAGGQTKARNLTASSRHGEPDRERRREHDRLRRRVHLATVPSALRV